MKIKFVLIFISLLILVNSHLNNSQLELDEKVVASIYFENNNYRISYTKDPLATAWVEYTKSLFSKGWDFLLVSSNIENNSKYSDESKSYGAGYLEGVLTAERIWTHYSNTKNFYLFDKQGIIPENLKEFIIKNKNWIEKMCNENKDKDSYWYHIWIVQKQLEGMIDGYNSVVSDDKKMGYIEFSIINASNEIQEIMNYYKITKTTDFMKLTIEEFDEYISRSNHCSVLIKIAYDFSNVWFGHNTWLNYPSMTRIFKEYRFIANIKNHKSFNVYFSSYPGNLSSNDDFYMTDKDLYISETTSSIFNEKLYEKLTPESVLTWQRVIVANRISDDAKTWVDLFTRYNSGTLNNQWQILDLKRIDRVNKILNQDALWILEQLPGEIEAQDVTSYLRYGYWPSYNIPFSSRMRELAGFNSMLEKRPELKDKLDYHTCARANIFRRDHSKVNSLDDFKKLMRYNKFQEDPLSKKNSGFAISCRTDLSDTNPQCFGATDAKVASLDITQSLSDKTIHIIAGPTTDNQIPFDTINSKCIGNKKFTFVGLPQTFNFNWIEYKNQLK